MSEPFEVPLDAPVDDVLEQVVSTVPDESGTAGPVGETPVEANEADVAEQRREVGDDDEDAYR